MARKYILNNNKGLPICLVYKDAVSVWKEYNVKRHYETKHADRFDNFTEKARRDKMAELRKGLNIHESNFVRAKNDSEAAVTASQAYLVSELIARNSRSFSEEAVVKECMLRVAETVAPDKRAAFANVTLSRNVVVQKFVDLATDRIRHLEKKQL